MTIDLAVTPTAPVTTVIGAGGSIAVEDDDLFGDFMGITVACSDFNGDGFADLIAGGTSDPFVGDKGKLALQFGTAGSDAPGVPVLSPGSVVLLLAALLGLGAAFRLRPRLSSETAEGDSIYNG
ncbi:MAG: hypothetical protein QF890_16380 [Myxococcota bacterium]|jgi:hypothetical protein|nr:hypothetical protein [Deltaproteobacteria bacterium]MCP4242220.1 hypothetical protein [bacterium]MDP6242755.1 hypothetical protein [Myxococcota bacterium]MDP7074384.1 hypothetical protein [Myxococcota bacterium]MDP7300538.1 hypothetical protein [Myxococcota bacterium]